MRVKEPWCVKAFQDMSKGNRMFICTVPVALGNDKRCLATVSCVDGKAIVRPSTLRCGILVVDWFRWMRYVRRHCLRTVPSVL